MSASQILPAESTQLPLLPLRDVVVFPHMVIPLFVGRHRSIRALELAMENDKQIMLVAQKSASKDEPGPDDMYDIGCVASILQMLKLPDGTVKVLVEGQQRARVENIIETESHFSAQILPIEQSDTRNSEVEALRRTIIAQFDQYVKLNKKIPPEILSSLNGIEEISRLADTISSHLPLKLEQKQKLLEELDASGRLEALLAQIETEIDILRLRSAFAGVSKNRWKKASVITI